MDTSEPPDLDAFVADLLAQLAARTKAAAFRAWLDARLYDWPITFRLAAAPKVLADLRSSDVDVTPAQLAALIDAFNFDDVQSKCDPLALRDLRRRAEGELLSPHFPSVTRWATGNWRAWLFWIFLFYVAARLLALAAR